LAAAGTLVCAVAAANTIAYLTAAAGWQAVEQALLQHLLLYDLQRWWRLW
jgi:hypothetical protein